MIRFILGALAVAAISGCSSEDTEPVCGDGTVDTGEECDDGNNTDGDGCSSTCQPEVVSAAFCGDGSTDSGEVCDDGNNTDGDGCSQDCLSDESCGNGVVDSAAGEACDDGNDLSGDGCQQNCALPSCGDGTVDTGEVCDDENNTDGDGCSGTCMSDESCGNGVVDSAAGEACDDGNDVDGDGCQQDCALPRCGDGILDSGEVCDDGNNTDGDGCSQNCLSDESCGNGTLDSATGEACDDGNNTDGDGCSAQCAPCGDGVVDDGETCDDGMQCTDGAACANAEDCVGVGDGSCRTRADDGCSQVCAIEAANLGAVGGVEWYRVPVTGVMTDPNVSAACTAAGLDTPCASGAVGSCQYSVNGCTANPLETSCGNPMSSLAQALCGTSPSGCPALYGTYQYMGEAWGGSGSCGAEQNDWCAQGNQKSNADALCMRLLTE